MGTITYTTPRANLTSTIIRACGDHEPLMISRNGRHSIVMLSLEDYKALEETAYLLRPPASTPRLVTAHRG
ncbi:type II toxin-antitoxin system Phd/YefM family antitoxin [Thauera butanivorans]|uniref:type II toxin-antitoxin system Phd/YefM family antitoxin n=1 Tax=Thauera butanivorans TaxID=86174 RepID=UPI003AB2AB75